MTMVRLILIAACMPLLSLAAEQEAAMNPVRKVVTLLQAMQKKVTAEGAKEKELFDKFMCYCKTNGKALTDSIAAAEEKISTLGPDIEEAEEQLAQAKQALAKSKEERTAAETAIKEATAIREKEAAEFAKLKAENEADVGAINKAVAALEKGVTGFVQTNVGQTLRRLAHTKLEGEDQDDLVSFLSDAQQYAPQSGQIIGILKQMADEMSAGFEEAKAGEETAIKNYEELMAAKKKELAALQKSIETLLKRIGDLGVSIAEMKNELGDTIDGLAADKKFLADLEKGCDTKAAEFEANQKVRAEELVALADTIKVLNDDDALELFKKTLPGAAASFMQVMVSREAMRSSALALIQQSGRSPRLDFIALALKGKQMGFEKIIQMIEDMIATLKTEQLDDDKKRDYCAAEFDSSDDKKKALERAVSDGEAAIAKSSEAIAIATEDIAALQAGIKALDKAVAEATEQRKEENAAYTELMASDTAAKDVLKFAKNRLNKFYNPKLYRPPAKRELTREDRITVNMGGTAPPTEAPGGIAGTGISDSFVQISAHEQGEVAPPPPPETFGAYTKKSSESGGVIAMIDLLLKDLDKEMTVATTEEKDAQADYEESMKAAAEKRAQDSKALTDREAAKADLEADLEAQKAQKASDSKSLAATLQYIASLHAECDWLIQYFDVRKEARASEVDSLERAKAVLSGADYSLAQTATKRRHLRRAA